MDDAFTMEYVRRAISENSLPKLPTLFESAFGRSPSLSAINAKHDTAFVGLRNLGLMALDQSENAVAFYGVFPVTARVDGHSCLVAQSGDTMVHKDHQGKGLFTLLARETYEMTKSAGVACVFGFPSPTSFPGFVKHLGWKHHENVRKFCFWVPTIPISEIARRFGIGRSIMRFWQTFLLKAFPRGFYFQGLLMEQGFDCIERSQGYWSYKLNQPGVHCVNIAGVSVVLKLEGRLGVGDFGTGDIARLRKVIFWLKLYCFFAGISRICTYVSPNSPQDEILSAMTTPSDGLAIGYVDFTASVSLERAKYCYFDMDTF